MSIGTLVQGEDVTMEKKNRRESSRRSFKIPVSVVQNGQLLDGLSVNISPGGMCLLILDSYGSPDLFEWIDDTVLLTFTSPNDPMEIITEATVCWSNGESIIGVRFDDLNSWAETALAELLGDPVSQRTGPVEESDHFSAAPPAL